MAKSFLRICITTHDIARIEKISQRKASQKMNDMRVFFQKTEKRHKITFTEYSKYSRIPLEEIEHIRLEAN
jgi:hypothetical protein